MLSRKCCMLLLLQAQNAIALRIAASSETSVCRQLRLLSGSHVSLRKA